LKGTEKLGRGEADKRPRVNVMKRSNSDSEGKNGRGGSEESGEEYEKSSKLGKLPVSRKNGTIGGGVNVSRNAT